MSIINSIFGRRKSASSAKERLKFVLINDRTDLTPIELERLKDDLIEAISRHVDIDSSAVSITVTQDGRSQKLVADIPLRSASHRR